MQCIHLSVLDTSWSYLHLHLPLTLRCSLTGRLSVVWRPVHMVHHSFTEINPCENRIKSRQSLFFAPSQAPNLPPGSFFPTSLGKIFCQKITQCCFQQRGDLPCLAAEFLLICLKFFLRKEREKRRCSARCHVTGGIGGPVDRGFRPAWHPTDRREPQWIVGPSTFKESSRSHLKKKQLTAIWQLKKSQDKSSETNEEANVWKYVKTY